MRSTPMSYINYLDLFDSILSFSNVDREKSNRMTSLHYSAEIPREVQDWKHHVHSMKHFGLTLFRGQCDITFCIASGLLICSNYSYDSLSTRLVPFGLLMCHSPRKFEIRCMG